MLISNVSWYLSLNLHVNLHILLGWSGGVMVLGKHPVRGCPTYLDYNMARVYCTCSRCRWGLFGHFFSYLFSLLFPSLWETALYRLKYSLKGPLSPKQPTNYIDCKISKYWDRFGQNADPDQTVTIGAV